MKERIKITLYNKTYKEIDMSDFTEITEDIFSNRDDIVDVKLPEGVKIIDAHAFENCRHLEKIYFPATLEKIGAEAFLNCVNLCEAKVPEGVSVDATSCKGCTNL